MSTMSGWYELRDEPEFIDRMNEALDHRLERNNTMTDPYASPTRTEEPPMPDADLLLRVLETVKAVAVNPLVTDDAPDEGVTVLLWKQAIWHSTATFLNRLQASDDLEIDPMDVPASTPVCGTAMCFAGWTVHLDPDANWVSPHSDLVEYVTPTGLIETMFVSTWAAWRLGITEDQADELFSGTNDLDDLHRIVHEIVAEAAERA